MIALINSVGILGVVRVRGWRAGLEGEVGGALIGAIMRVGAGDMLERMLAVKAS